MQPVVVTRTVANGSRRDFLHVDGIEFRRHGPDGARFLLYVRDNGSGKDQLVIEADDGTILVLMTDD
jgi:hypothetical protein